MPFVAVDGSVKEVRATEAPAVEALTVARTVTPSAPINCSPSLSATLGSKDVPAEHEPSVFRGPLRYAATVGGESVMLTVLAVVVN